MTTWRLVLEYDGTPYGGWQRQPDVLTVQEVLEEALGRLFGGERFPVIASGRTDAGVHALAQVVSFRAEASRSPDQVQRGLNALLPPEVGCLAASVAEPDFHAIGDARGKHYRYVLRSGSTRSPLRRLRSWTTGFPLDVAAMREALSALPGTHDFSSFRASGCMAPSPERILWSVTVTPHEDELHVDFHGRSFLRHMVRNVVGSLVEVGRGKRDPQWLGEVLAGRDRRLAGPTAPPQGLFLVSVDYDREAGGL